MDTKKERGTITPLTPYLAQKWAGEGMRLKEIAAILNRNKQEIQRALEKPLHPEDYACMERYRRIVPEGGVDKRTRMEKECIARRWAAFQKKVGADVVKRAETLRAGNSKNSLRPPAQRREETSWKK